jgi:hypothetical protein
MKTKSTRMNDTQKSKLLVLADQCEMNAQECAYSASAELQGKAGKLRAEAARLRAKANGFVHAYEGNACRS